MAASSGSPPKPRRKAAQRPSGVKAGTVWAILTLIGIVFVFWVLPFILPPRAVEVTFEPAGGRPLDGEDAVATPPGP